MRKLQNIDFFAEILYNNHILLLLEARNIKKGYDGMFSVNHFIWLGICIVVMAAAFYYLKKYKPSLTSVLTVCCALCILSEVTKTFSVLEMVPTSDGSKMHAYLEMGQVPLHLCSIQIAFIFFVRFTKNQQAREKLLAFMYPSCILGAFFAMMIPTIFSDTVPVARAFTHPQAYQYFLYHAMLIVLGVYIVMSNEIQLKTKHYSSSLGILGVLGFASIYLNSIFAVPVYESGALVSVEYTTNFLFTHEPPIAIPLTEKWHWFLYLGIIGLLAVVLIGIFYMPFILKERKEKKTAV